MYDTMHADKVARCIHDVYRATKQAGRALYEMIDSIALHSIIYRERTEVRER